MLVGVLFHLYSYGFTFELGASVFNTVFVYWCIFPFCSTCYNLHRFLCQSCNGQVRNALRELLFHDRGEYSVHDRGEYSVSVGM